MIFRFPSLRFVCLFAGLIFCMGCGGGDGKETAPVTGKVTQDGKAVSGGTITFLPVAEGKEPSGKPASGEIKEDGSYTLSTYGNGDGAVIGKHNVTYSAPSQEDGSSEEGGHAEQKAAPVLNVEPKDVEVKSEANTIDLKLTPAPK